MGLQSIFYLIFLGGGLPESLQIEDAPLLLQFMGNIFYLSVPEYTFIHFLKLNISHLKMDGSRKMFF